MPRSRKASRGGRSRKKAGHGTGFLLRRRQLYFLSVAWGSAAFGNGLSEAAGAGAGGGGGGVPVAPVADEDVLGGGAASAFGASAGAGVGAAGGVVAVVLGAVVLGAVVLGAGAAGGGVTVFSSFLLQAERPIARQATSRSERFMFYPLAQSSNVHG